MNLLTNLMSVEFKLNNDEFVGRDIDVECVGVNFHSRAFRSYAIGSVADTPARLFGL